MRRTGTRHASWREIADLVDGVLAGVRLTRVREHVEGGCMTCAASAERLRGTVQALSAGPLPAPPTAVSRRAAGLYGAAWRRSVVGRVREVLASLIVDQRLAPALALRGAPGTGRRLLWTIPGAELVVSVTEGGARSDLRGQVLPDDDDGDDAPSGTVELLREGVPVDAEPLDAEGEFALWNLPPGTYVLRGRAGGAAFRTPPFVLGRA